MKAIALLSGGLDSTLAIKVVQEQGIEVEAVNFVFPFCRCDGKEGGKIEVEVVSEQLNVKVKVIGVLDEYLDMVKHPKYGYGKNLNPCIDCRIMMFQKAKEYMAKTGARFIITGEVLGQRPMSQNRQSIALIEKKSEMEGLVVRPLSAKLFEPTIPEKQGWLDREKLLGIQGRSRKEQLSWVKKYDISGYACPAGGCLLTDPQVSKRLRDLMDSGMLTLDSINLITYGRYLNLSKNFKLIVGRNEKDNTSLMKYVKDGDLVIQAKIKGPTAVGRGKLETADLANALGIVAYYCQQDSSTIPVEYRVVPDGFKVEEVQNNFTEEMVLQYRIDNARKS